MGHKTQQTGISGLQVFVRSKEISDHQDWEILDSSDLNSSTYHLHFPITLSLRYLNAMSSFTELLFAKDLLNWTAENLKNGR